MSPAGFRHGKLISRLTRILDEFVDINGLGSVTTADTGFKLNQEGEPDTVLAPDIAFVSAQQLRGSEEEEWDAYPRLAPALVVEVASPNQSRPAMAAKAELWLAAGVQLVWVVWPKAHQVDVWEAGARHAATLDAMATLDGREILPGFALSLAHLFAGA